VDFFCLRKRIEGGEAGKLSTADLIVHADAKLKFNHSGIGDLYQKWRSGQLSFDQVRKEYQALRRPETVTFILLSREWPGGLVRASSEDPCETCSEKVQDHSVSTGDFTPSVTLAET